MTAQLTVEGNLVADPELKFTQDGKAYARFRVADTARVKDRQSGEWSDGATLWVSVTLFGRAAESFAEHGRKGRRVVVSGRLTASEWTGDDGQTRHGLNLTADVAGIVPKPQPREQFTEDPAPF